ncbi:MAG: hemin-degrading factor [Thalassobaculales bacterium]
MVDTAVIELEPLLRRWQELRGAEPRLRIRDAADRLGVSERDLLLIDPEARVRRLLPPGGNWHGLVAALEGLGEVMALTRNDHCVHERVGRYGKASEHNGVGLVLMPEIDLRIFYRRWHSAFAVEQGGRQSLQVFDRHGLALHKVYLTAASDRAAYDRLVATHEGGGDLPPVEPAVPEADASRPDDAVDLDALRAAWDGLTDTHDFFPMLRRLEVGRLQALRLAGGGRARAVAAGSPRPVLEAARDQQLPIMVFVGSPGVIQIHTGRVENLVEYGPWFNVMDPRFNLHLKMTAVARAFVVAKPTSDGPVTSLEIFDDADRLIALFFGRRKPGEAEDPAWTALLSGLASLP